MTHPATSGAAAGLQTARHQVAESEFELYDFGEVGFQDCGGWEYTSGGTTMTRPCYITDDSADAEDAPTLKVFFTVRFKESTAEVEEVYAINNGTLLGRRGQPHPDVLPATVPERSNRADVRNPMLAIAEVREEFAALPPEARQALVKMLRAMTKTFRVNADKALRKHKPPMYAYWKASAVNARHLALAGARHEQAQAK